jgi:hypothetical protein
MVYVRICPFGLAGLVREKFEPETARNHKKDRKVFFATSLFLSSN